MAHYVQIPKDLGEIKQKFLFGLTKRQVISFGIGGALGVPLFFLTRNALGLSGGIMVMGVVAAPAIICGLYKKNGMYFEQTLKSMYHYFTTPRKRTYRNYTIFEAIENELEYRKIQRTLRKLDGGKR